MAEQQGALLAHEEQEAAREGDEPREPAAESRTALVALRNSAANCRELCGVWRGLRGARGRRAAAAGGHHAVATCGTICTDCIIVAYTLKHPASDS